MIFRFLKHASLILALGALVLPAFAQTVDQSDAALTSKLKSRKASKRKGSRANRGSSLQDSLSAVEDTTSTATSTLATNVPTEESQPKKVRPSKLSLGVGMLGQSTEDEYLNSKWGGGSVSISGSHQFNEYFESRISVFFLMASGVFSNQYLQAGAAPNFFVLDEIALKFTPWTPVVLEAGILETSFTTLPSALQASGFPGLKQTLKYENDYFKVSGYSSQTIPTSGTRAVKPTERGETTGLMIFGLELGSNVKDAPVEASASVSRFDFQNLNASAATDSQFIGNTVDAVGPQARFRYDFAGYEGGGTFKVDWTKKWSTKVSGSILRNALAPDGTNLAYMYTGTLGFPIAGLSGTLSVSRFYNESDTIPATYASFARGQNNRFGNVFRLSFENKKEKFSGYAQYIRANEIENRSFLADRDIISMGLEVKYDIL